MWQCFVVSWFYILLVVHSVVVDINLYIKVVLKLCNKSTVKLTLRLQALDKHRSETGDLRHYGSLGVSEFTIILMIAVGQQE